MYTNILVPIVLDHGDRGSEAVAIARALLRDGGKITLLHVLEEIPAYASNYLPEGLAEQHRKEAIAGLKEIAEASDMACETEVVRGHSSTSILDYAARHGTDCIVIASHKPGFEDFFLGSTAARVVRHAKCGVHVLR